MSNTKKTKKKINRIYNKLQKATHQFKSNSNIEEIEKAYLRSLNKQKRKLEKRNTNPKYNAFKLFSLDASALNVLDNITEGGRNQYAMADTTKLIEREFDLYATIKKSLQAATKLIEKAKKENDAELLNNAKDILKKIPIINKEIFLKTSKEKHKLLKNVNALYKIQLEDE